MERYESVQEFCARVGIKPRTFARKKAAGDVPVLTRIGDRILIAESDSAAWLAAHREVPGSAKAAA